MQMTKKVLSIVLAVMMVVSMMVVGTVVASAADPLFEIIKTDGTSTIYTYAGAWSPSSADPLNQGGGVIKLLRDFEYTKDFEYSFENRVNFTLDLNGHTLTMHAAKPLNINGINATVKNGKLAGDITIANDGEHGTTVFDNVDLADANITTTRTSSTVGGKVLYGINGISTEQDLIDAAAAGGSYLVVNDIALTGTVTVAESLNLNLGGNTISGSGTLFEVAAGKKFEISNGTVSKSGDKWAVVNNGTFNIMKTATLKGVSGNSNGVKSETGSVVNVYGTVETGNYGVWVKGTAKVNARDGCVMTSQSASCLSGNGTGGLGGYEINVYGGTITSVTDVAIYHPNDGELWINGGVIQGATAVYVKSGTTIVNINKGTFIATGAATDYRYYGSGCYPTGDAVVIDNCGYPGGAPEPNIKGGTYTSENGAAIASYVSADDPDYVAHGGNPAKIVNDDARTVNFISGGNFSSDVTALVVDGKISDNVGAGVAGAPFTITVDPNPLNPLEVATPNDGNAFGLNCKYLKGTILGVQKKDDVADAAKTSENKAQETGNDMRFVAVLDKTLIQNATDYGFVLAKVGDKTYGDFDMTKVTKDWGNGEKKVSAKGTFNNISGVDDAEYEYITCAVNGVDNTSKVLARFYYTDANGKTYYAKYTGHSFAYTGCIAGFDGDTFVG